MALEKRLRDTLHRPPGAGNKRFRACAAGESLETCREAFPHGP